jgi:hypothetical protein
VTKKAPAREVSAFELLLERFLSREQVMTYLEAVEQLRYPLPERTQPQVRPFAQHNLELQNRLGEVRAELLFTVAQKRAPLYKLEAQLRLGYKDDKVGSEKERSVMCYSDPTFADQRLELDGLDIVADHINDTCWRLRSQLNLVGG